ncbi:tyrosine-type recombinase/integrase [Massilia aquatica]|uniref:Site-specific integrase n=1 Tax=Massilia aquatica TaxID=2609000 RepID=A0ABX0MM07_9BURK|nr:site-specific integrase [Massilia aquatica]NHZ44584.1 site-specific integrase [Massilia aquatica]
MLIKIAVAPYYTLVSPNGMLPRYWSTVWALLTPSGPSSSSRKDAMRHLDYFYTFCDGRLGPGGLDDALGNSDTSTIVNVLQAFYVELSSRPEHTTYAVRRWYVAKAFIQNLCSHRRHLGNSWREVEQICVGFPPVRATKSRKPRFVRALPAAVLADLLKIVNPESERNPFRSHVVRRRNWLLVHMMLLLGLRRSECLVLPVDALKQGVDPKSGETRWWLNVVEHKDDEDSRFTLPSIKNEQSRRQLPVSPSLARHIESYVGEFRGEPEHGFLFTSRSGAPLSVESVNNLLTVSSACLSEQVAKELTERTNGKNQVSPHDLRHTCAVIRLKQFLSFGISHEEMMQRMRGFFGWAYESHMPLHYAKAAYEERLADVWSNTFDEHTNILRSLPQ